MSIFWQSEQHASWPQPNNRRQRRNGQQEVKQQQLQQLETLLLERRASERNLSAPPIQRDDTFDNDEVASRYSGRTSSTFRTNESLFSHRSRVERNRNPQTMGVSVHWLKHGFLKEVQEAGLSERSTIYDIEDLRSNESGVIRRKGQHVVCPIDNQLGSAYVHALGKSKDNVGAANFMLSYVWGYPIGDIVDALWDHCSLQELDPKRTYIWICCLCVNQHRVASNIRSGKEIPFRTFRKLFYSRATAIGHILAMFAPWDKPVYVQRVWTIFEFFTASTDGHNVTVIMPPREKRKMAMLIATKGDHAFLHRLYKALQNTKVEEAEASYESDKTRILQLVERNTKVSEFNAKVNELLRRCVLDSVMRFAVTLDKVDTLAVAKKQDFLTNVGRIILARGEYEDSLEKYTAAVANLKQIGGDNQECTASCYDNIGLMLLKKNDLIGAHKQFSRARRERLNLSSGRSLGHARSKINFGRLSFHQGQYDDAVVRFEVALSILGKNHPETAQVYDALGLVWCKKGDPSGAKWYLYKALNIRKAYLGQSHPATATSRNNIGVALFQQGRYDEAREYHEKALSSRISLLGPDHPDTASSQNDLANCLFHSVQDVDRALQLYRSAYTIRKSSLGTMHPDTKASYESICKVADFHHELGKEFFGAGDSYEAASEEWQRAFEIRSALLGPGHPDTKVSHKNLVHVADFFSRAAGKHLAMQAYDAALRYHQKALKVRKDHLGCDHKMTAMSESKLCSVAKFCFNDGFCKYIESALFNADPKRTTSKGKWSFNGGGSSGGATRPFCQACWTRIERSEPRFLFEPLKFPQTWFYHCTAKCLGAFETSQCRAIDAEKPAKEDAELGFLLQDFLGLNTHKYKSARRTVALPINSRPDDTSSHQLRLARIKQGLHQSSSCEGIHASKVVDRTTMSKNSLLRKREALLRPSIKDTPRLTGSHQLSLRYSACKRQRLVEIDDKISLS